MKHGVFAMISLKNLYAFLEGNFDYLLVVDSAEQIIYISQIMKRDCFTDGSLPPNPHLKDALSSSSLNTFRTALSQAKASGRGMAIYTPKKSSDYTVPLKVGYIKGEEAGTFLFFGNRAGGFGYQAEWEKEERIKELSCLYEVSEWIEASSTIKRFFTELPRYLSAGMMYPDEVSVYSIYQGVGYGQKYPSDNYISVLLVVGDQDKGEIRVGYRNDTHELLQEEQQMLNEIGRTVSLALERKQLLERISLKEEEEKEYSTRLATLKKEIETKTQEVEEQSSRINIVDSYLSRVNKEWEETKTRLETLFQAVPDDIVLIDRNRKIVMTNRKDIQPGVSCYKGYFNRERPCDNCRLARIIKDKAPLTITMKQHERYLQVHALPVYNKDHEVDGILEFYRDVTLEKSYERQLQQADKLASLGQLVSGIGHEINNPNQFIHGNIKIIKQSLEDILPIMDEYYHSHPELKIARLKYDFFRQHIMTLVDDMSHGSERIKGIIEGLRSFARKDEGLLVDKVDLNTLIESSTRLVHNEVRKQAGIVLDLAKGIPTFTGNSQKIEQILINLMVNASHAMPEGKKGIITIRTRVDKKDVVLEVEDNGKGMNENTLKQIFNPFFTTKRSRGGTGLGLAIAYRIIEEHGGNISVISKPGVGTTFTIRLPIRSVSNNTIKVK
jgi:signal transduction histidine kinase